MLEHHVMVLLEDEVHEDKVRNHLQGEEAIDDEAKHNVHAGIPGNRVVMPAHQEELHHEPEAVHLLEGARDLMDLLRIVVGREGVVVDNLHPGLPQEAAEFGVHQVFVQELTLELGGGVPLAVVDEMDAEGLRVLVRPEDELPLHRLVDVAGLRSDVLGLEPHLGDATAVADADHLQFQGASPLDAVHVSGRELDDGEVEVLVHGRLGRGEVRHADGSSDQAPATSRRLLRLGDGLARRHEVVVDHVIFDVVQSRPCHRPR
mmetsp:Transcript_63946/g.187594  ORF Transcript_63946/g.187594 Transcript_63946/m.187594 type:complete len:261 (+) Transcript_63946:1797-2579(+)